MKKYLHTFVYLIMVFSLYYFFAPINALASDGEAPTIELNGNETIYLKKGTSFVDVYGARANDAEDGDLSDTILVIDSEVNVNKVGHYYVTYRVFDSDGNVSDVKRKIVVFDPTVKVRTYSNDSSYYSALAVSDMIPTPDGGFIGVGQYHTQSTYSNVNIFKVNLNGEIVWEQTTSFYSEYNYSKSNSNYITKITRTSDNNYLVLGYNSHYDKVGIIKVTETGLITKSNYFTGTDAKDLVEYLDNKYAVLSGTSVHLFDNLTYKSNIYVGNANHLAALSNGKLITTYDTNDVTTTVKMYNPEGTIGWSKTLLDLDLSEMYVRNDMIILVGTTDNRDSGSYAVTHGGYDGAVIILDKNGNLFYSRTYGGTADDFFVVSDLVDDKLYLSTKSGGSNDDLTTGDYGIAIIDIKNLDILYKADYDGDTITELNSISGNNLGQIFLGGKFTNYNYIQKYSIINLLSFDLKFHFLTKGDTFNFSDGISLTDIYGEEVNYSIDSVEGTVDTQVVGYYDLIYNISVNDDYSIRIPRYVGVSPRMTINTGNIYFGGVLLDIDGGTIAINGVNYNQNDYYSMPGLSTIKITGINGYEIEHTFTIDPIITGVEDNETYYGAVNPVISGGNVTLNGESYITQQVTKVGKYTLIINGANGYTKTIEFQILPEIIDNRVNYDSITPNIDALSMTLDGMPYNNETISTLGEHVLVVNGINGLTETINFKIEQVFNVTDDGEYLYSVVPVTGLNEDATYKLNGKDFNANEEITQVGEHFLAVYGKNSYLKIVKFTVKEKMTGIEDGGTYEYVCAPTVNNVEKLVLNNEPFTSGTIIDRIGNYTLIVYGLNYVNTYHFTVKELVQELKNNGAYYGSVTPRIDNAESLILDGHPYVSGTEIKERGKHTLVVIGVGGYTNTYSFTVNYPLSGVEDGKEYFGPVKPVFSEGAVKLNGEDFESGTVISDIGRYQLEIIDEENNLRTTINFDISPALNDGAVFYESLNFNYENVTMRLDGLPYNRELIDSIGEHTLEITALGGYYKSIRFTVIAVKGTSLDGIYQGSFTPIIDNNLKAEYYLDCNPNTSECSLNRYTIGEEIIAVGYHTLYVLGDNGKTEEYEFTITEVSAGIPENDVTGDEVTIDIPNVLKVEINGEEVLLPIMVSDIGNYRIKVFGTNGYTSVYSFAIKPVIKDIIQEGLYDTPVVPDISSGTLILNGNPYVSGTPISDIGNHILDIIGVGGYKERYYFTIKERINIEHNDSFLGSVEIKANVGYNLDGVDYTGDQTVVKIGRHTIEITGLNGYENVIEFNIEPIINGVSNNGVYEPGVAFSVLHAEKIMVNDKLYANEELYEIGTYIVKIYGEDDVFVQQITFTIKEIVKGINDGIYYSNPVSPEFDYVKKATLNGSDFISGQEIKQAGKYELVIHGINDYTSTYTFYIKADYANIIENKTYPGSVTPIANNAKIKINGEILSPGEAFTKVGKHLITFVGENGYTESFYFTIDPIIKGVENGGIYDGSVLVTVDNALLELNGVSIDNNTIVTTIGNNQLTILGPNDYSYTIGFTIKPVINNLIEDGKYIDSVIINLNDCELRIDDEIYQSGTKYVKKGYHTLVINGVGGYTETINFMIEVKDADLVQDKVYPGEVTFDIPGATLSIDGMPYDNKTVYSIVGYHTLTIIGSGDYQETVDFLVTESNSLVLDGYQFTQGITVNIPNSTLKLNGKEFQNGTFLERIGNHELTIVGTNGYTKTINFSIHIQPNVKNKEYHKSFMIKKLDARMILNGKEMTADTEITENGAYKLEIIGEGGYSQTIEFTYDNHNLEKIIIIAISGSIMLTISVSLMITRRKVN